jgi:hypothetical protein
VITSLDPARNSSGKYETVVVNAHGCGVIVSERLEKETRVTVELIASGRSKQARIVLAISLVEGISWLLGLEFDSPAHDFWEIENPPAELGGLMGSGLAHRYQITDSAACSKFVTQIQWHPASYTVSVLGSLYLHSQRTYHPPG